MSAAPRTPQDAVELELIRSLTAGLAPSIIMTTGFTLAGALIVWMARDPLLLVLLLCGIAASTIRVVAALRMPRPGGPAEFPIARARMLEQNFRMGYLAFAATLSLFGLRAFMLPMPHIHMLMLCLLMGYTAGVAATIALRPRIAIPSMIMGLAPAILAPLFQFNPVYVAMSLMTAGFLTGGLLNLRVRYANTVEEIALRITFGNIARKDSLTALPNRIALREWFQERCIAAADGGELIAVHYLDLDGFKPINDRFGHPFGDALLAAVSKRIVAAIRDTDLAARLGGDEFAIVQFGIESPEDAERLARRLVAAIARPYNIEDRIVRVETSIGYVAADIHSCDLEQFLTRADQALYVSKRQGGGITRYDPDRGKADKGKAFAHA
ncbi:MAG: GGDEF domain-containing protein [Sphingobium sp.]|nr:GGDEF domain-containing protein [Sphingobium sp.]